MWLLLLLSTYSCMVVDRNRIDDGHGAVFKDCSLDFNLSERNIREMLNERSDLQKLVDKHALEVMSLALL